MKRLARTWSATSKTIRSAERCVGICPRNRATARRCRCPGRHFGPSAEEEKILSLKNGVSNKWLEKSNRVIVMKSSALSAWKCFKVNWV